MMDKTLNIQKVNVGSPMTDSRVLYLVKTEQSKLNLAVKHSSEPLHAVAVRSVILSGPKFLYQSLEGSPVTGVYTIRNYSNFIPYNVSVTAGSVSRTGDQITVTAPYPAEDMYLIVNGEASRIEILVNGYLPPTTQYPLTGVELAPLNLAVEVSVPVSSNGTQTFDSLEVQIATDADFTQNVQLFSTTTSQTEYLLENLQPVTLYWLRTRHVSAEKGPSGWSEPVSFTTRQLFEPMNETAKLLDVNGHAEDWFGRAVDINSAGTVALIAARQEDTKASNAGAAYIFRQTSGVWTQEAKLMASDGAAEDNFGYALALSKDGLTAVISAYKHAALGVNAGAAYVFKYVGGVWTQVTKLLAPDGVANDYYGWAVDINANGTWIAIGAWNQSAQASTAGATYLYELVGGVWTYRQKLLASDGSAGAHFGGALQFSNDGLTLLIGAPYATHVASYAGLAYVFTRNGGVWSQQARIQSPEAGSIDYFGSAVSLTGDGNLAAITSYFENAGQGKVYLFSRSGGVWTYLQGILPDRPGAVYFGWSLDFSVDGSVLCVGSYGDTEKGTSAGAGYLFIPINNVWTQQQKFFALDFAASDYFGYSVGLNATGTVAICGAFRNDDKGSNSGSAYIFGS